MFGLLGFLVAAGITAAVGVAGYWQSRKFVVNRLRYVDAIHTAIAPVIAGLGALVIAVPIVAFLPIVGTGTAVIFGASVAMGVASGSREIRKRLGA